VQNTADHATWRSIEQNRGPERERDTAAHASARSDSEERRREQLRNTADHATWRSIEENRGPERGRDAAARAIFRSASDERRREQSRNTDDKDKIEDPKAHGTLQCAQSSGRIPRSDDESSRETLLILLYTVYI